MPRRIADPKLAAAKREAESAFKPSSVPLTHTEQSKKDFDENRERLKALRLTRDTELAKNE
jgi:hypothetical protein